MEQPNELAKYFKDPSDPNSPEYNPKNPEPNHPDAPTPVKFNLSHLRNERRKLEKELRGPRKKELRFRRPVIDYLKEDTIDIYHIDNSFLLRVLPRFTESDLNHLYNTVMQRIEKETQYFDLYKKLGIFEHLLQGFASDRFDNIKIYWNTTDPYTGKPAYYPNSNEIMIAGYKLNKLDILTILLKDGFDTTLQYLRYPDYDDHLKFGWVHRDSFTRKTELSSLAHEMTHARQYQSKITSPISTHQDLIEVHARRMSSEFPPKVPKTNIIRAIEVAKDKAGNPLYPNTTRNRLIYATIAIDLMDALDIPIEDIGRLCLNPGPWDEKKGRYIDVDLFIIRSVRLMVESQKIDIDLKKEDFDDIPNMSCIWHLLENSDIENLFHAHKIKRDIERLKSVTIARDELRKFMFGPEYKNLV